MAKSQKKKQEKSTKPDYKAQEQKKEEAPKQPDMLANLPEEAKEKLKQIKAKLDSFSKKITEKFDKYIIGVSLLPPPQPEEGKKVDKDELSVLVLIDDSEPTKMSKMELRDKLFSIIINIAKEVDEKIKPETILLSEVWQNCYDGKSDLIRLIAMGAPVYDTGMLSAIKIAEIHKTMILKKFEKYIVSYVLAGSLVQGRATPTSDIDVWVVIDDTDVKKMTRAELKDKLRAIIIGMGIEAGEMTGIKNKLNIQVYILTDFWDSLKEANPIIFTLLRDGVPFYDRGVFMPWKLLLKMGKIKPSAEAIDMFMGSGEQMLSRVHDKIKDIGMEDIFYAILTPSQAAIMLFGLPPPTPRETPDVMMDLFVNKEKILEAKYVDMLKKAIQVRKDMEHGVKKDLSGKELDELLTDSEKYLKRIRRLFTQIEKMKEEESILYLYDSIITVIRDILRLEGIERVSDDEIVNLFKAELVHTGKVPEKFLRMLGNIVQAKKDYDSQKLTKHEVEEVKKESGQFIKFMVEYLQRKRGRELEKTRIRVKHGETFGEVTLLGDTAFIVHDIDQEEKTISKAKINPDGSLGTPEKCTIEELEKAIANTTIPQRTFIKQPIFDDLKRFFGKDVEILVTY
jgi:predicted nucleotidyltransferase/uncharacterized protein (UPF0332 family)